MSKIANIVVSVLILVGFVVYLAGVAQSNNLCNKAGKGSISATDLITSGPEAQDKNFLPLGQPWGRPAVMASSSAADASASSLSSSTSSALANSGLTPAQQQQVAAATAAANQALGNLGRKTLSAEQLFPSHARALMGTVETNCGWTYSLAWWTVALQGLATIGAILLAVGVATSFKPTWAAFFYVNTALLCGIAFQVVPLASNLSITKTKGAYPNAVYATAAGLIITLVSNFFWFIALGFESNGSVEPAK